MRMVLPIAFMMVRRIACKTARCNRKIAIMGKGEVEQCENAQHPDNHRKWFARPDHFAKTFPFKETIIQFYFFCKIDQNNQQEFLKKSTKKREIEDHREVREGDGEKGASKMTGNEKRVS